MCEDRFNAVEICNQIKASLPKTLVMTGGPTFSYSAEDALTNVPSIDVVVMGEGEVTSYEVFERFEEGGLADAFDGVLGCAFRQENEIVVNSPRPLIQDLDALPSPAWHLFPMDMYDGTLGAEEKTRAIGVISSRGCPNRCIFCSNSLNRRLRFRDPKLFVDEMEYLHEKYNFPGLNIQDDSFTSSEKHVTKICEEIIDRDLSIKWYCSLRVNNISFELLELMRQAGCVALGFGIESGSDRVLKLIKKDITKTMAREAVKMAVKAGYRYIGLFFMTSLPGETLEDVKITSNFKKELRKIVNRGNNGREPSWFNYEILTKLRDYGTNRRYMGVPTTIYPGTEVERIAKENGNIFPPNFSWYKYYENPKAKLLNYSPHVPLFENPDLSLEEIFDWANEPRSLLQRIVLRFVRMIEKTQGKNESDRNCARFLA